VCHKRWLDVANVGLEIVCNKKPTNPKIPNPALNGKYVIQGVLDYTGIPNRCPIIAGQIGKLKLSADGKFAIHPIMFIDCLDIKPPSPHRRCYTWYFGGVTKPIDQSGLIDAQPDGEITLEDLLEDLGATRDMLGGVKFDAEGGGDFSDYV